MSHQTETKRADKTANKPAAPPKGQQQQRDPNEGEGNRTAARRYDAATEAYVKSGRSDGAAQAAAAALDGPEKDELKAAEKVGKSGHPKHKS